MTRRWNTTLAIFLALTAGALLLPGHKGVLIALAALAAANFAVAMAALLRTGRLSWLLGALTALQLVLFARLHAMVYSVLGPQHYACAVDPQWYHWLQLIGAHVARATDILDVLEDYHINLQAVRSVSTLAGTALVAMHFMVDLLLIGALVQAVRRRLLKDAEPSTSLGPGPAAIRADRLRETLSRAGKFLKKARWPALVATAIAILFVAQEANWRLADWVLWPLDNIVRTLDFTDAMQIYRIRWHSVEMTLGVASLAVWFRLILGLCLAEVVGLIALRTLRGRGKTVTELRAILRTSPNPADRRVAAEALGRLGPHAAEAIPDLVCILARGDWQLRQAGAWALGEVGPAAAVAVPALLSALVDSAEDVRFAAAEALQKIDRNWRESKEALEKVPDFVRALADGDWFVDHSKAWMVRQAGAWALGEVGAAAGVAVRDLVRAVFDTSPRVAAEAAHALGKLGPKAAGAIGHLLRALVGWDDGARSAAAEALDRIDPRWREREPTREAMPRLAGELASGSWQTILSTAKGLAVLGPAAAQAVPGLVRALKHSDSDVRKAAHEALERIDPDGSLRSRTRWEAALGDRCPGQK